MVPDVFELPCGLEAPRNDAKAVVLVEGLSNLVARECVESQAATGLTFGPVEQLSADAQPMKAYADVELRNRLA